MLEMENVDAAYTIEILFSEYDVKLESYLDNLYASTTPKVTNIPMKTLLNDLSSNIHNTDSTEMYVPEENKELVQKLKSSMIDTFRSGTLTPISNSSYRLYKK